MQVKDKSVSLVGLKPEMRIVLKYVDIVYSEYSKEPVITAGTEPTYDNGKFIHSPGSYHPFGYALDFRIWGFTKSQLDDVIRSLKTNLGDKYDVILEGDHIHIEYNY